MSNVSMSDAELLKFAIENGMIDTALVQEKIEMQKRKELLDKHPYSIWKGKDGKWRTYLPEKDGRKLIKRSTEEGIDDAVVKCWKAQQENPTLKEAIVPKQFNWIYSELMKNGTGEGFIFVNPKHGNRFTTNSLRRRQERNCKKLKFYQKSPHKGLLDNKLDNNIIIQQMGHTDISTTEKHYHRNMKDVEKKADIISKIHIFDMDVKIC